MKSPKEGSARESISIMHRFHFTSALKRMAVTVKVRHSLPLRSLLERSCAFRMIEGSRASSAELGAACIKPD